MAQTKRRTAAKKAAAPKEPAAVESIGVEGYTDRVVLTLNGNDYRLDTQQLLALRKQLDAAAVGANY